jgi:hypothetical protein
MAEGIAATLPQGLEATVKPPQSAGDPADQGLSQGDFRNREEREAWASNIAPNFEASADAGAPCHAANRAAWTAQSGFSDFWEGPPADAARSRFR